MALLAKEGGSLLPPIPEATHHAVCFAIYDIGTQFNEKFGKSSHQCFIMWELPDERINVEKDGELLSVPRIISKKYTLSLNEKANLRKDLQSWRGRAFTPEELDGFDLKHLIGVNCMLQVIHNHKDNKVYANISAIIPLHKSIPKLTPENQTLLYEITDDIPEGTPTWLKDIIYQSAEMMAPVGTQEQYVPPEADDDVPF